MQKSHSPSDHSLIWRAWRAAALRGRASENGLRPLRTEARTHLVIPKFFIREREHISTLRWRWRPALHVAAAARGASAIRHTAAIASAPRRARCCTFAAARLSPTAPARATEGEFGASGGEWTAARRWHRRHFCRLAARGDGPGPPRRAAAPLDRAAVVDCAIHGPLLGARARDWRRAGGAARLPGARRAQPRRDLCLHGGGRRHLDPHHRRQRRA